MVVFPQADPEVIQAGIPQNASLVPFAELLESEQQGLKAAVDQIQRAYPPKTGNHRAAAIVASRSGEPAEGLVMKTGVSFDGSHFLTNCAERGAFYDLPGSFDEIQSVITISRRFNGAETHSPEPPVAPCGGCRGMLTGPDTRSGRHVATSPDTRLVMSDSEMEQIWVVRMGDFSPFSFLNGETSIDVLANLNMKSFNSFWKEALVWHNIPLTFPEREKPSYAPTHLTGGLLVQAFECATDRLAKSDYPVLDYDHSAVAIGVDGKLCSGLSKNVGQDKPQSAILDAMTTLQSEGTSLLQGIVVYYASGTPIGKAVDLEGRTCQYIFDRAQLAMIDIPVVFVVEDLGEIVVLNASDLLLFGEGHMDSPSIRPNLPRYRMIGGEVVEP